MATPINELYFDCIHYHDHDLHLANEYEIPAFLNVRDLVGKALKRIFKARKADVDPDLMEITYRALEESVNIGAGSIKYGQPNYALAQELKDSAAVFSSAKSLQQAKELAALTIRPDGKVRSWEEFLTLSKSIDDNYNQNWLKVEFNTGIRKASAAVQFKKFEENANLYPNLEYMPSKAATPSEEHKVYWHIIKPIGDDFWKRHMPPSRYNCQCWVQQTDDDEKGTLSPEEEPAPGLDNNPALTGKLFGENHPYIAKLTESELKYVMKKAKQYVTKRDEDGSRPG